MRPLTYGGRPYRSPVYDRSLLVSGARLRGPALVADAESTTLLPPGHVLLVDSGRNLVMRKEAGR